MSISIGGTSPSLNFAETQPLFPSPYAVGVHIGIISATAPEWGSLHEIPKGSLEIQALKMDVTFWCYKCGGMASGRTCPHPASDQLQVSGTQLRKWLSEGSSVPAEFSRPEVLEVLREYYARA